MNSECNNDEFVRAHARATACARARAGARARARFELIQLETITKPLQFPYESITK